MSLQDLIQQDIENKYWFAYGQTPLGGNDYWRPETTVENGIQGKTANFGDTKIVSEEEYLKMRDRPLKCVGLWNYQPADGPCDEIRFCETYPTSAGHELARLKKEIAALEEELEKRPKLVEIIEEPDYHEIPIDVSKMWPMHPLQPQKMKLKIVDTNNIEWTFEIVSNPVQKCVDSIDILI